jgi:ubiquinone biosynthesis protein COQ9
MTDAAQTQPDEADFAQAAQAAEARVLARALRLAPELGWTWRMTYAAGKAAGLSAGETELLLPRGPRDLAALFSHRCDRDALAALAELEPATLKMRARIRHAARARLAAALSDAPAARRWAGFLALPGHLDLGLRLAWESADGLWRWAGDQATDENHYSKRAILAEILVGGLAVWLAAGEAAALAHLDRRIEGVMAFERFKGRLKFGAAGQAVAEVLGRLRYGGL